MWHYIGEGTAIDLTWSDIHFSRGRNVDVAVHASTSMVPCPMRTSIRRSGTLQLYGDRTLGKLRVLSICMGIGTYIGPTPVHIEPIPINAAGMELGLYRLWSRRVKDIARGECRLCLK